MKIVAFLLLCFVAVRSHAAGIDYSRDIQPVLAEHCFRCHGKDEAARKSGLRLDERAAALRGGESGEPAIIPGDPEKSALLSRVLADDDEGRMPPPEEKHPVKPADIEKLRQWIKSGAPFAGHWAFESPRKPALPAGADREHPVDAFINARLKQEGLTMSAPASPETVCRRLHLDLIGLPPSPAELDDFAREAKSRGLTAAVGHKAEALMKDRRFGEKWARHWLDVARYSDSNGFEKDLPREQWIWRDWVIDAMNRDLPYDRFIIDQIAGDLLPGRTQQQLIATGFLRNSMVNEEGAIVPEEWRMEAMFDRMDAIGSGILGLSVKCAQCHTHKFDPISHNEYYGLFSFLNNTYEAQSWVYSKEQARTITKIHESVAAVEARLKSAHKDWEQKLAAWEATEKQRGNQVSWTVVVARDTHSSTELNHPTVLPDHSILTLGHRTISGDVHLLAKPPLTNVTGIRLEILTHGDLPFGGPGRSFKGTWALSELMVETQTPGSKEWQRQKLVNVTSDFAEPSGKMEPEWENKSFDKEQRRVRGPVAFLADGDDKTAWRADRGPGHRNAPVRCGGTVREAGDLPGGYDVEGRPLDQSRRG